MITLQQMSELAAALVSADADVAAAEAELSRKKEVARRFREETIPCAMQELGLELLQLDTGEKINLKQEVFASLAENGNKEAAFDWLEEHDFGGIIKTHVMVEFGKGELKMAQKLQAQIIKKMKLPATIRRDVHAQTLKAFLKEQLRDEKTSKVLPLDLFGARPVTVAKITQYTPRSKK